jgi:hypothetical protein
MSPETKYQIERDKQNIVEARRIRAMDYAMQFGGVQGRLLDKASLPHVLKDATAIYNWLAKGK